MEFRTEIPFATTSIDPYISSEQCNSLLRYNIRHWEIELTRIYKLHSLSQENYSVFFCIPEPRFTPRICDVILSLFKSPEEYCTYCIILLPTSMLLNQPTITHF